MEQTCSAPSYEQQVSEICSSLLGSLSSAATQGSSTACPVYSPVCVAPSAAVEVSGTAVCQLQQSSRPAQHLAEQLQDASCLPELLQQAGVQHLVEVHLLPGCAPQQQQETQVHEQIHPLLAADGSCSSRAPHADLQLFLHELEQSQWTVSAAAALAAPAPNSSSHIGHVQEQQQGLHGAAAEDSDADQHTFVAAGDAVLAWLAGVHGVPCSYDTSTSGDQQHQGQPATVQQQHSTPPAPAGRRSSSSIATNQQQYQQAIPGSAVHPNLQPVLQVSHAAANSNGNNTANVSGSSSAGCVVVPYTPTDAESVLRHSPAVLGGDMHLRFLLHQLLHALSDLHARGFAMGGFCLNQLRLVCPGWVQLLAKPTGQLLPLAAAPAPAAAGRLQSQLPQQQQHAGLPALLPQQQREQRQQWHQGVMVVSQPSYTLPQLTEMWRRRVISNFEYLLWVNAAAGRRWGDRKRHPFVPWVLDFSRRPQLDSCGQLRVTGVFAMALTHCQPNPHTAHRGTPQCCITCCACRLNRLGCHLRYASSALSFGLDSYCEAYMCVRHSKQVAHCVVRIQEESQAAAAAAAGVRRQAGGTSVSVSTGASRETHS